MEENDKRELCYAIITIICIVFGVDVSTLTDKDILTMLESLDELIYHKLLDIENTLYTIYYEQSHKEEE